MSDERLLAEAATILRKSKRIVVFSGAGISVESGVPAFRGGGGLWTEFPPDVFATRSGLTDIAKRDPDRFWEFLCAVIGPRADAEPNAAHRAVADLESFIQVSVVTQNIDGLHHDAGSRRVYETHGSLREVVYRRGKRRKTRLSRKKLQSIATRLRRVPSRLRLPLSLWAMRSLAGVDLRGAYFPNLVLFGDMMAQPAWDNALAAAQNCDFLLQIGCSCEVYPAATLPSEAKANGAAIIAIDVERVSADISLVGPAAQIVPRVIDLAIG